jgi:L-alanine-DL-glutamate epimerase-like enolase superfamily enzyme
MPEALSDPHDTAQPGLRRIRWGVAKVPLSHPYDLSFTRLTEYHAVWVAIEDDAGRVGLGEAVALPGYGWETDESVEATIGALLGDPPLDRATLIDRCRDRRAVAPFAVSAVMTALELPRFLDRLDTGQGFPLNSPVSAESPPEKLTASVDQALAAGYRYIKVKVGRDLAADVRAARLLLTGWEASEFELVFDANQAYRLDDALRFTEVLHKLDRGRLLWFEQPVHRDDWAAMARVCSAGGAPVVLDECIFDADHIARAADMGAHGVKLKLFKNFGIVETLTLARQARARGLTVVFGNGVATDIGNLGEYVTLAAGGPLFSPPAESSGFVKLARPLLPPTLAVDAGRMVCRADPTTLARHLGAAASAGLGETIAIIPAR